MQGQGEVDRGAGEMGEVRVPSAKYALYNTTAVLGRQVGIPTSQPSLLREFKAHERPMETEMGKAP